MGPAMLWIAVAALLAVGGVVCLAIGRREPGPRVHLAGVGAVSRVSACVFGLALLGLAYHVVAHTISGVRLRAPMGIATGVAVAAMLTTLLVDAVENRVPRDRGDAD